MKKNIYNYKGSIFGDQKKIFGRKYNKIGFFTLLRLYFKIK